MIFAIIGVLLALDGIYTLLKSKDPGVIYLSAARTAIGLVLIVLTLP